MFGTGGMPTTAGRAYYLTDANANVTAVVQESGGTWGVAERYVYSPYGTVTYCTPSWTAETYRRSPTHCSLFGSDLDTTGQYYDEARWYSSSLGTFITQDPAKAELNLYGYCGDNPVICVDPSGLWKIDRANGATATATSEQGDTIGSLAEQDRALRGQVSSMADDA